MATAQPARPDHPRHLAPAAFARRSAAACINLLDRELVRGRDPRRRGPRRRRRPARRPHRQAHRPLAAGQVHRRRADEPREDLVGRRSTGRSARRTTTDLRARLVAYCAEKDLYAQDCFIGAAPAHRRSPARLHRDRLGEHLRAEPLPPADGRPTCAGFEPELHDHLRPLVQGGPRRPRAPAPRPRSSSTSSGWRSSSSAPSTRARSRSRAFTVMNYLMPDEGVLPMHSSVNVGAARRRGRSSSACRAPARRPSRPTPSAASSATTSTAGAGRPLQLRGRLLREDHPPVPDVRARHLPDDASGSGRSSRTSTSTRTRASWTSTRSGSPRTRAAPTRSSSSATPIATGIAGQPRTVVLLTADAFGVLPPISRLTHAQAAYHFISGYTAKLAGTEVGVKEPKATFSACFGAPFMPRHPGEYAAMLDRAPRARRRPGLAGQHRLDGRAVRDRRADEHRAHPRDGPRRPRRLAGLGGDDGSTRSSASRSRLTCPDVPASFLDPRATWADQDAYDRGAAALAAMFAANFAAYADGVTDDVRDAPARASVDPTAATPLDDDPGAG